MSSSAFPGKQAGSPRQNLLHAIMDPTRCAVRTAVRPDTPQAAAVYLNVHVTHAVIDKRR
ncbi:hypothetical protein EYS09_18605 [Streptomyces kasugaensis]|uniref:Uncharacterized protein n=1 Tax=Streptomyces kasugaensis TaxID=1946 RepID=A0A4Q9HT15_STRKA|nr:hypothetical protein [Streptomyces kasugaensis]TBO58204.1 hypothetical protein EYS09_18605 [Streptomyces kasugaensis]